MEYVEKKKSLNCAETIALLAQDLRSYLDDSGDKPVSVIKMDYVAKTDLDLVVAAYISLAEYTEILISRIAGTLMQAVESDLDQSDELLNDIRDLYFEIRENANKHYRKYIGHEEWSSDELTDIDFRAQRELADILEGSLSRMIVFRSKH